MKSKVVMDLMEDLGARKVTYKKRKETLVKKLDEITTLCGVEAGLIIYSELEEGSGPLTWPANAEQLQGVVARFKAVSGADLGGKKVEDVESLTEARLNKEKLRLAKMQVENEDKGTRQLLSECLGGRHVTGLSVADLRGLNFLVDDNLKSLRSRMSDLSKAGNFNPVAADAFLKSVHQESNFAVTNFGFYLNSVTFGMDMMGDGSNVAASVLNGNGLEDQAGSSGAKDQGGMSGWGLGRSDKSAQ